MVLVRLFISAALACCILLAGRSAHAWEVCNETSFVLRVATAITVDSKLTPKGWSRARPGQCLLFVTDDSSARYVYAESSVIHPGGIREWRGENTLCASDDDFTANTDVSCALQDLMTRDYLSIDPKEKRTRLVEVDEFGENSSIAGMQRLLKELGYSIPKIDGKSGRQTRRSLTKFVKDQKLTSGMSTDDKIDALEAVALVKGQALGITVCNEAATKMWISVAYRDSAAWIARGWWAINPKQCLRPHTQSIKGAEAHIYALLESSKDGGDDSTLKPATTVPTKFCIAQSRFAVTERENCADRGYRTASFRPLATDTTGIKLSLSEADFNTGVDAELRR